MIHGLDLFSGIGGISLALAPWVRTVAYCENDRYVQGVLLSQMRLGGLRVAPIWDDVRTLSARELPSVDILTGGFPCQDISVAGAGAGLGGSRSGLFFEIVRLARELRPRFLFLENVPAITVRGLDRVLLEFTALGYDCRWTIVSAAEMGAPHLRERWFLLAHANGVGSWNERQEVERSNPEMGLGSEAVTKHDGQQVSNPDAQGVRRREGRPEPISERDGVVIGNGGIVSDSCSEGRQRWLDAKEAFQEFALGSGSGSGAWPSWLPEPAIRRGADGTACRVDRLRGLGNAVVPQTAREAFRRLMWGC